MYESAAWCQDVFAFFFSVFGREMKPGRHTNAKTCRIGLPRARRAGGRYVPEGRFSLAAGGLRRSLVTFVLCRVLFGLIGVSRRAGLLLSTMFTSWLPGRSSMRSARKG